MTETLTYYDKNADEFIENTKNVDFSQTQNAFMELLPREGMILDFGCGSGRDTKYFLCHGFCVEATDGSEELCRLASDYTGITVRNMLFQDLDEHEKYDGIWACASLLHLRRDELIPVMCSLCQALQPEGAFYVSFKYGSFEGEKNGRYFTDFTLEGFSEFVTKVHELQVIEYWITMDVRNVYANERWLNILLKRTIK